jgi:hypothetical protein
MTPFFDDVSEPLEIHGVGDSHSAPAAHHDLVTAALVLVARMTPTELAAFRTHLRFPVRLVGAERPEALACLHSPDVAGDP